jgi:hypothetical protein
MFCVPQAVMPLRDALLSVFWPRSYRAASRVSDVGRDSRDRRSNGREPAAVDRPRRAVQSVDLPSRHVAPAWNVNRSARTLVGFLLKRYVPRGVVRLCGDETIAGHRGKKVFGNDVRPARAVDLLVSRANLAFRRRRRLWHARVRAVRPPPSQAADVRQQVLTGRETLQAAAPAKSRHERPTAHPRRRDAEACRRRATQ